MRRGLSGMTIMNKIDLEKEAARLDGFLSGIASMNGEIRDYSAYCYLIENNGKPLVVEELIRNHFSWLPSLEFSENHLLQGKFRDLEIAIRPFIFRDNPRMHTQKISDMRRYLSFRIMERIGSMISADEVARVVKMNAKKEAFSSDSTFFCIASNDLLIVLQFNDDRDFKKNPIIAEQGGTET
jgi:hypothetical protein